MTWELLTNIMGPRGYRGVTGADGSQGLPGVNAVANDTATAGYIKTAGTSATKTALLDQLDINAVRQAGAHPRVRKPLTEPIFEWADSSSVSLYWPFLVDNSVGGGTGWSLYYSTDHASPHADSGIFRANAATPFGPFVEQGRVFRDDSAGFQTETPTVWWEAKAGLWFMTYQQANVGVGNQSTLWASSPDGNSWTRQGILAEWIYGTPGDGHTGYFRRFVIGASEYAYSLYGGASFSKQALWTRDDSAGTNEWTVDPRQICSGVERFADFGLGIVGSPSSDPNDSLIGTTANILWKAIGGGVVEWRGRPWWVGQIGTHGSGGAESFGELCVAPLTPDYLGLAEAPNVVTPAAQSWEGGAEPSASGNIFTYQNRTYLVYGTGKQGGFGLMEIY